MKNTFLTALITNVIVLTLFLGCSKNEEEIKSPFTVEQLKVLQVLNGSFISNPDIIGTTTTFNFTETYIDKPETIIGKNIYGETKEMTIHGFCEYYYTHVNNNDNTKYARAYIIDSNGIDVTLYHLNSDNTINLNSSFEKYKIIIINNNQIKFTNVDFPFGTDNIYNKVK